jgi:hypothetical protein
VGDADSADETDDADAAWLAGSREAGPEVNDLDGNDLAVNEADPTMPSDDIVAESSIMGVPLVISVLGATIIEEYVDST